MKVIYSLTITICILDEFFQVFFSMPVFHIVDFVKYMLLFALFAFLLISYAFYQVKIDGKCFNNCFQF